MRWVGDLHSIFIFYTFFYFIFSIHVFKGRRSGDGTLAWPRGLDWKSGDLEVCGAIHLSRPGPVCLALSWLVLGLVLFRPVFLSLVNLGQFHPSASQRSSESIMSINILYPVFSYRPSQSDSFKMNVRWRGDEEGGCEGEGEGKGGVME